MHCMCMRPKSHPSYLALLQHYGTIAHQAPLSMGFSRQEWWIGFGADVAAPTHSFGVHQSASAAALPWKCPCTWPPFALWSSAALGFGDSSLLLLPALLPSRLGQGVEHFQGVNSSTSTLNF